MKHKRLLAILLTMAMMLTFMPAMAFADESQSDPLTGEQIEQNEPNEATPLYQEEQQTEDPNIDNGSQDEDIDQEALSTPKINSKTDDELLPPPAGLQWDRKTAKWSSDVSDRNNDFEVSLWYSATENGEYSLVDEATYHGFVGPYSVQKYNSFDTDINKSGFYKFSVTEVKEIDDNEYIPVSETAKSGPIHINKVSFWIFSKSKDETSYQYNGGGRYDGAVETINRDNRSLSSGGTPMRFFLINGEKTTVYGEPYGAHSNYRCTGFSDFVDHPVDITTLGNKLELTVTGDADYAAYFDQISSEKVQFSMDLGKGHEELAQKIKDASDQGGGDGMIIYQPISVISVNGSVLNLEMDDSAISQSQLIRHLATLVYTGFDESSYEGMCDQGQRFFNVGRKTTAGYGSYENYTKDMAEAAYDYSEFTGKKFYAMWFDPVKKVDITVKAPVCGQSTNCEKRTEEGYGGDDTIEYYYFPSQTNRPVVSIKGKEYKVLDLRPEDYYHGDIPEYIKNADHTFNWWISDKIRDEHDFLPGGDLFYSRFDPYCGKFKGGKSYKSLTVLSANYGYFIDEEEPPEIIVNGKKGKALFNGFRNEYLMMEASSPLLYYSGMLGIVADNIAVHDWKNVTGGRKCKGCGAIKNTAPLMAKIKTKGKKGVKVSWNAMAKAEGYDIFFARCNNKKNKKKYAYKLAGTVKAGEPTSWTKTGLKKGVPYKVYVRAYYMKNGKKKYISKSPSIHAFTNGGSEKSTNPKGVKVKKKKVTLKAGKTYKIKAKVTKLNKSKKLVNTSHAPKLRYLSTDPSVATVSKSGKIKGKAAGKCKVYVYAVNGAKKVVSVKVK